MKLKTLQITCLGPNSHASKSMVAVETVHFTQMWLLCVWGGNSEIFQSTIFIQENLQKWIGQQLLFYKQQ